MIYAVVEKAHKTVNITINLVIFFAFAAVFFYLQYLMKRFHNFEYRKNFKASWSFFTLITIFSIIRITDDFLQNYDYDYPKCKDRYVQA